MTRDEALAVLTTLPLDRVVSLEVPPRSVIVCELARPLDAREVATISEQLGRLWPGQKILVCQRGVRLSVEQEA